MLPKTNPSILPITIDALLTGLATNILIVPSDSSAANIPLPNATINIIKSIPNIHMKFNKVNISNTFTFWASKESIGILYELVIPTKVDIIIVSAKYIYVTTCLNIVVSVLKNIGFIIYHPLYL